MGVDDLTKARYELSGHKRCVVCKNGEIYSSEERGIKPMLLWLKDNPDFLKEASVADKIVGKASAMIMIHGGVKECFAEVISERAIDVLNEANIHCDYINKTQAISNRRGDGICPMEKAISRINDPDEAFKVLWEKVFDNN